MATSSFLKIVIIFRSLWILLAFIGIIGRSCTGVTTATAATTKQPNIIIILTDDQDTVLHGMFPMQNVQRLIGAAGATFTNAFTSSPLCCPSRASILSGLYAHNHKTKNNSFSGGCYGGHWCKEIEPHTLPVLLQNAGYDTYFAGKYLNEYDGDRVPPGWKDFNGLHGNSRYYNFTIRNNAKNVHYTDVYLTDLLRDQTIDYLTKREYSATAKQPFFAMISTPAPHAPFTPAERHVGAFKDIKALRTPNFNVRAKNALDKHWLVANSEVLPTETINTMDLYFQKRWESLLAVDELVAAIFDELKSQNHLDDTYIIYMSDNGYHVGQFAQPFDKRQPYETDIRVPLLVYGPNVPRGVTIASPVLLIDILPTILEWAKLPIMSNLDGESFNSLLMNATNYDPQQDKVHHRSLLIQHWGEGNNATFNSDCQWQPSDRLAECTLDADCHCQDAWNNTYACIRHFRHNVDRLYCEFHDEEDFVEAYNLDVDPYQMTNVGYELLPIERAFYSLALANLTQCSGDSCKNIHI